MPEQFKSKREHEDHIKRLERETHCTSYYFPLSLVAAGLQPLPTTPPHHACIRVSLLSQLYTSLARHPPGVT